MRVEVAGEHGDMKTKWHRKGHDRGVREVVTRGYTHVGWKPKSNAGKGATKMKNRKVLIGAIAAAILALGVAELAFACACCGCAAPAKTAEKKTELKPQSVCPVMGGKIDKNSYVDVKGKRVYLCCAGCKKAIKADPDKYLAKIKEKGEKVEDAPVKLCKCGEVKGSAACAKKCAK
jgi:YHS domain-containing protein